MAVLFERVRDFQRHPALSKERQAALYGISTPITRRASLPAAQGNGATKASADTQSSQHDDAQVPLHTTDDLPRLRGLKGIAGFPWHVLFGGLGALVALYTVLFGVACVCIGIGNLLQYGPIHTSYTHTTINGQPATIIASNERGDITLTIKVTQLDSSIQVGSYSGPILNPEVWNGDLSGIVVTAQVAKDGQTITVHLVGDPNYFHPFLVRPTQDFSLLADKQGYKVTAT